MRDSSQVEGFSNPSTRAEITGGPEARGVPTSSRPHHSAGTVLEQNAGMTVSPGRWVDVLAMVAGAGRLASGLSFLVAPEAAHRVWGGPEDADPTTKLLLRSMGYRDALIGGLLLQAGLRRRPTTGWFLASAGADATDVAGGLANLDGMTERQRNRGLGGGVVGIAVGLLGGVAAARARR